MFDDWSAAKIKFKLDEAGYNLRKVSEETGVGYQSISNSLRTRTPSGDRAICEILGVDAWVVWPSRYGEGETPTSHSFEAAPLTEAQKSLLGGGSSLPERRQSWTKEKIEQQIKLKGFPDLRAIEAHEGLPSGAISQSASRKTVQVDQLISRIVGVPVEDIWPHRYWVGGDEVPSWMKLESRTDEEFDKLRDSMGRQKHSEKFNHLPRGEDGRFVIPVGEGKVYADVPAEADKRQNVSLPPGVTID